MSEISMHQPRARGLSILVMICKSPLVFAALLYIVTIILLAVFGPMTFGDLAGKINMPMRGLPPFQLNNGWLYVLGSDNLGRSLLARLATGASSTLFIAVCAVAISLTIGVTLGVVAGYFAGWQSALIMRVTDAIMSFPTLLLAILLLYIMEGQSNSIIFVLALSRIPMFVRTARAEVLEMRERLFVSAARTMGISTPWILARHILRPVAPTLLTLAGMEIAFVMLSESSLSFIGLGVQSPQISWGLMVSQGAQYLSTAWWLAVVPGTAIVLSSLSINLVVSWIRLYIDPKQRWRVEA